MIPWKFSQSEGSRCHCWFLPTFPVLLRLMHLEAAWHAPALEPHCWKMPVPSCLHLWKVLVQDPVQQSCVQFHGFRADFCRELPCGQSCATRILRAAIQHRSWKAIHMDPDVTPCHCRWSLAAKHPMHLNGTIALWPALHAKSESRTRYLFKLVWSSNPVYMPWKPSTSISTWVIVPLPALSAVHGIRFLSLVCPYLSDLDLLATEFRDIKQFIDKSPVLILCCYSASVTERDGFTMDFRMLPCNGDKSQRNFREATLQDWPNLSGPREQQIKTFQPKSPSGLILGTSNLHATYQSSQNVSKLDFDSSSLFLWRYFWSLSTAFLALNFSSCTHSILFCQAVPGKAGSKCIENLSPNAASQFLHNEKDVTSP